MQPSDRGVVSAMLPFIIAECGAKVRVIAHRRLISSPTLTHTHTHAHTGTFYVPFGLPLSLSRCRCDPCCKTTALSCGE